MSHVLLIDPSPLCRELLAKALEGEGLSVTCTGALSDASRALDISSPRLIVLDPAANGQGIQFLQLLRQNPKWKNLPVIVLTDLIDKTSVLRIAQLGVHDYILKSRFSLAELLTRIQKYVRPVLEAVTVDASTGSARPPPPVRAVDAAQERTEKPPASNSTPPPRLTRDETLARIEESAQAKTLAGVVSEVIALVNSPRGAISDVAHAVKRDPVLSARILHLANSAAFGSQKPRVSSIDEAVRNIGVAGVRNMALAVGIFDSFPTGAGDLLQMLRVWQHLFAVAAIMERLVPVSDAAPPGTAHLVGLSHELPQLALQQRFAAEYAAATELAKQRGRTIPEVAGEIFGIPFHELATVLLEKFGLPPLITAPIREFFERGLRQQPAGLGSVLARTLRIANVLAHGLMLAPSPEATLLPITKSEYRSTFGDTDVAPLDGQALWSEAVMMVNMLSGAPAAIVGQISKPLIPPGNTRIWYWRHATYSDIDPLETLLRFGGHVEVHDGLPKSADDLADYDLLVAASSRHENPALAQSEIATIGKLIMARPLPVLYLSGVEPAALTGCPPGSCYRLPIPLSAIVDLFARCSESANNEVKRAARIPQLSGKSN